MRQVLQYQKTGELSVQDVPPPVLRPAGILVANVCSLISPGTERLSLATAKASLLEKARSRPDLVRQVVDNLRKDGLLATYQKVKTRLDDYKALGYSSAGRVLESACDEFLPGDRAACAGTDYANHAEIIWVPRNLAAKIPDGVDYEEAAFATLGAIALQGVRQAEVKIGETVAVIGLGLIGLLTLQILKAAGCRVLGLDIAASALSLARELGADLAEESEAGKAGRAADSLTAGLGVDAVIISAASRSNEPVEIAGAICRDRGRVVVVGAVRTDIPRSPFYEKEIEVRMSRSYGPGRYDHEYEEKGRDYPAGYVRWTEQRNLGAFLRLVAERKVNVRRLITHRFALEDAIRAYDVILGKTNESRIGVLFEYPASGSAGAPGPRKIDAGVREPSSGADRLRIGFIGAGHFAQSNLLPHLRKDSRVRLQIIADSSPLAARSAARKFRFSEISTDCRDIWNDAAVPAVFIATRHDSHAPLVLAALKAGKKTYVEKPLAIEESQLAEVERLVEANPSAFLTVGFNRRFSRQVRLVRSLFENEPAPLVLSYRVNAGPLPKGHWLGDPDQGGRVIGEACHFIDTMAFVAGSRVRSVYAQSFRQDNLGVTNLDNITVSLRFVNGSLGTLSYFATGDSRFPKEYFEVFGGGKAAILNDYREVYLSRAGKKKRYKFDGSKGHREEIDAVVATMSTGQPSPIPFEDIRNITRTTFAVLRSLATGSPQDLGDRSAGKQGA